MTEETKKKKMPGWLVVVLTIAGLALVGQASKSVVDLSATPTPIPFSTTSPEQVNALSEKYCKNREKSVWQYPGVKEDADSISPDTSKAKTGTRLTKDDCTSIVKSLLKVYSAEDTQKITEEKYWVGMDKMALVYSIGIPSKINNTVVNNYKSEQWIYPTSDYGFIFYYFRDGKLYAWQD